MATGPTGVFFEDSEGETVFVPQDRVQEAAADPSLSLQEGQQVTFTSPTTGRTTTVTGEQFLEVAKASPSVQIQGEEAALQASIEAERGERLGGPLGMFVAGSSGLARGATLGASDVLGRALGSEEVLRDVRAENPGISIATEIAGAVAPGLISGGTGTLGTLLRAMPASQATRLGLGVGSRLGGGLKGAAVGASVEGTLFGAGQGVSNIMLRDEPLSAEAAFAEIGMNSIYGAGLGGVFGAGGHLVQKAGQKILSRAEARSLNKAFDFASEEGKVLKDRISSGMFAIDDASDIVMSKANQAISPAARDIFDETVAKNLDRALVSQADQVLKDVEKMGIKDADSLAVIKRTENARDNLHVFLGQEGMLTKTGAVDWAKGAGLSGKKLTKIDDLFLDYTSNMSKMSDLVIDPVARRTMNTSAEMFAALSGISVVKRITPKADEAAAAIMKDVTAARNAFTAKMGVDAEKGKVVLDDLFRQEPKAAMDSIKAFDDYTKKLSELSDLVDAGGEAGRRMAAASDDISRSIAESIGKGGQLPEIAQMAVLFGIEETLLPDVGGPAGDILKLYFAHKLVKGMGKGRSGKLRSLGRQAAVQTGRGVGAAKGSGKSGIIGIAQREVQRVAAGKVAGAAFDYVNNGMSSLSSATAKSASRVEKALAKTLITTGRAARRSSPVTAQVLREVRFTGQEEVEKKEKLNAQDAYKARARELNSAIANLQFTQQQIHDTLAPIREINLGVGDKMAGHAARVLQFLHQKMPKDPGTLQQFGVSKWRPTESDLDKWARYVNAAKDPAGIVERFSNGHMSREDAEVLRDLYHGHFVKTQEWIAENIDGIQKSWKHERRIQASILMNMPADPTMAFVDAWQQSFAQEEPQSPQRQFSIESQQQPTQAQQLSGVRE